MNQIIKKLVPLERKASAEKGDFALFALFVREDTPNQKDLVVSAAWLEEDKRAALRYLTGQLRALLDLPEMLSLSGVILVDRDNPGLAEIHEAVTVEHGTVELVNERFFGSDMERAYIITSKRDGLKRESAEKVQRELVPR